jgi:lauroyl/myristoyl acyltransferase
MAVSPSHVNAADLTLVNRVRSHLRFVDGSPGEFHAAVDALGEEELKSFGYDYYYFNLLSVFGSRLEIAEIRRLAVECNKTKLRSGWDACRYTLDLKRGFIPSFPRLDHWNVRMIQDQLSRGKGLVICTAHFGPFRHVTSDLLMMGYNVTVALDSESSAQMKDLSALVSGTQLHSNPRTEAEFTLGNSLFRVINVERSRLATATLLATLKRNEIVLLYLDGNTGFDGPRGQSNRVALSFLGHQCMVKSGVASLAVLSSTPLIHVLATNDKARPRVALQHLFEMNPRSLLLDRQQRVAALTQKIYGQLERLVLRYPNQWESACLLHRWRAPATANAQPPAATPAEVFRMLEQGGPIRLKSERVVRIGTKDGPLLVDVDNLRAFQIRAGLEPVLQKLYESEFSYSCFQDITREHREDVVNLLSTLHSLQWITPARSRTQRKQYYGPITHPAT